MVKQTLYAHEVKMGDIPLRQPLPTQSIEQIDPFLLLHHHTSTIEKGSNTRQLGVGPHPHRGFSPVTFIFQGDVHHRDSRGNSSIVHSGGVQWMNSGMGIIHSERPSAVLAENGGIQEIIQLWINTPASQKMNQPAYQAYQADELPSLAPGISLVSGTLEKAKGPALGDIPVLSIMGTMSKDQSLTFQSPHQQTLLYILEGELRIEGHGIVEKHQLIWFDNEIETISLQALEPSKVLYLSADPINESLATYGPFVMNNQTEIMEAMRDYQMGKMGVLIEEF